jgi:hypothetical protein
MCRRLEGAGTYPPLYPEYLYLGLRRDYENVLKRGPTFYAPLLKNIVAPLNTVGGVFAFAVLGKSQIPTNVKRHKERNTMPYSHPPPHFGGYPRSPRAVSLKWGSLPSSLRKPPSGNSRGYPLVRRGGLQCEEFARWFRLLSRNVCPMSHFGATTWACGDPRPASPTMCLFTPAALFSPPAPPPSSGIPR